MPWGQGPTQLGNTYMRQLEQKRSRMDMEQERQRQEQIRKDALLREQQGMQSMFTNLGLPQPQGYMSPQQGNIVANYQVGQVEREQEQLLAKAEWDNFLYEISLSDENLARSLSEGPPLSPNAQTSIRSHVAGSVKSGKEYEDWFKKEGVKQEQKKEFHDYSHPPEEVIPEETKTVPYNTAQIKWLKDRLIAATRNEVSLDEIRADIRIKQLLDQLEDSDIDTYNEMGVLINAAMIIQGYTGGVQ